MKKILIIIVCLLLLVSCKDKEPKEVEKVSEEEFVVEKIDSSKELVYFAEYRKVNVNNEEYAYQYPIINIKSEEIDNLNLELKNFVLRSYKSAKIIEENLNSGNVVNYSYYVTDKYISIVQKSCYYINGTTGEYSDRVYVISLDNGKIISNEEILKDYDISEKELYKMVENKIDNEDKAFAIMNIKANGYYLYIDNEEKLGIIFYEITDEAEIRNELVLN